MIHFISPAPLPALAAMRDSAGLPEKFATFGWAAAQLAHCRSWGMWTEDRRCVAVGGLYDHGDGSREAWFACLPEAAREMVGIVRQSHLTLRLVAESDSVRIFARVRSGNGDPKPRPGARIAAALGMALKAERDGFEIWELQ